MANKQLVLQNVARDLTGGQFFDIVLIDGGTSYTMYVRNAVDPPTQPGVVAQITAAGAVPVIAPSGGGDVVGTGTTGTLMKWVDGPLSIAGDSLLVESGGSIVQATGNFSLTAGNIIADAGFVNIFVGSLVSPAIRFGAGITTSIFATKAATGAGGDQQRFVLNGVERFNVNQSGITSICLTGTTPTLGMYTDTFANGFFLRSISLGIIGIADVLGDNLDRFVFGFLPLAANPAFGFTGTTIHAQLGDGSAGTALTVLDEAYGPSWNGSIEVPTKNAVFDKIEAGATLSNPYIQDSGSSAAIYFEYSQNTPAVGRWGVDNGTVGGTIFPTAAVNATVFGSTTNTPVEFFQNNIRFLICDGITTLIQFGGTQLSEDTTIDNGLFISAGDTSLRAISAPGDLRMQSNTGLTGLGAYTPVITLTSSLGGEILLGLTSNVYVFTDAALIGAFAPAADLGTAANPFGKLFLVGTGIYGAASFEFTGIPTGNRVISIPDVTGTVQLTLANVSAQAATPVAVAAADTGKVYTNEGAAALGVFNLPAAAAGLQYTFIVQDADGIQVTADGTNTIRVGASVSSAGGTATSTTVGSVITLVAINATEWIATSVVGVWVTA